MKKAPLSRSIVVPRELSPYDRMLLEAVQKEGGFYNAHSHLDRADTLGDEYLRHIGITPTEASGYSLRVKQDMTGDLHRGLAYTPDDLEARMIRVIQRQISYGVTALDSCIDVTPGIEPDGLTAFRIASKLKQQFADQISIRLGPMPIFGFKEGSGRWEVFESVASEADFFAALPEKDVFLDPRNRDGKIGFREHLIRVLELGCRFGKEVHIHLDQANNPAERGTETLIEGLRWIKQPHIPDHHGPTVWIIHKISPSGYGEKRHGRLMDGLLEYNLGVKVCGSAALSMRQLRPIKGPTRNSVARVLELCKRKIPVQLGTDNICDVYVPQSDGDMLTEIKILGHAVRFAPPHIWAKLAAGVPLNEVDRDIIGRGLYQDLKVFKELDPNWEPAVG